jgi:multidrug resistance efflux pump
MKRLLPFLFRFSITVVVVAIAVVVAWQLWVYYMLSPWTRDGRVRADVVPVAADVSGLVSDVFVHDNQLVKKGDPLFRIDQKRFELALQQA